MNNYDEIKLFFISISLIVYYCIITGKTYLKILDFIKFFMYFLIIFILSLGLNKGAFFVMLFIVYLFFYYIGMYIYDIPDVFLPFRRHVSKKMLYEYYDKYTELDKTNSFYYMIKMIILGLFFGFIWYKLYLLLH